MADGEKKCPECKAGAPDWMVTFSDLMTLLLTFFVLLLSMAVIEQPKFERVASSLHQAFNGVKIIGKPIERIIEDPNMVPSASKVRVVETDDQEILTKNKDFDEPTTPQSEQSPQMSQAEQIKQQKKAEMLENLEKAIQDSLSKEIDTGVAEIEKQQDQILLRFPAEATFKSGSADIDPKMKPTFEKLALTLKGQSVQTVVTGHTDDIPINTLQYRSNWDLSAARAASIAMEFQTYGNLRSDQIEVVGFADGLPIATNDSPENRKLNRRIEVFIEPNDKDFNNQLFENIVGTVESTTFSRTQELPDSISTKQAPKQKIETDSIKSDNKNSRLQEIIERIRSLNNRRR